MFNLRPQGGNWRSIQQISEDKEYSADAVFIPDADFIYKFET